MKYKINFYSCKVNGLKNYCTSINCSCPCEFHYSNPIHFENPSVSGGASIPFPSSVLHLLQLLLCFSKFFAHIVRNTEFNTE